LISTRRVDRAESSGPRTFGETIHDPRNDAIGESMPNTKTKRDGSVAIPFEANLWSTEAELPSGMDDAECKRIVDRLAANGANGSSGIGVTRRSGDA
jgi:hypothetical protein